MKRKYLSNRQTTKTKTSLCKCKESPEIPLFYAQSKDINED